MSKNNGKSELENLHVDGDNTRIVVNGSSADISKTNPLGEQSLAVSRQMVMVILGNVGSISTGICLGLPTVTYNQFTDPNEPVHFTESQVSWMASVTSLFCPVGALLSALILDRYGRKVSLYVLNVLSVIGWAVMIFTSDQDSDVAYTQLMISRIIHGIASGLVGAPIGLYAAEISVPKIRGRLLLANSVSIALGFLVIYTLGFFIRNDWMLLVRIIFVYSVVSLLCVVPMPESYSWLILKGRLDEARKSLNYFRGLPNSAVIRHSAVLEEFNLLRKNVEKNSNAESVSFIRSLRLPEVYKPLLILFGLIAFQQLSGIFVVVIYAVQIASESGVTLDPFLCAILLGVGRVATTCLLSVLLEIWGRRRAGMISAAGMSLSMFLMAAAVSNGWLKNVPYLPVMAIVAFIITSTLGLYTLPFFMVSELFPQNVRGTASGFTVAVGMLVCFFCIKTFPQMRSTIGYQLTFILYGLVAFVALIFIYFVLPETRGRTLLEIEENFRTSTTSRRTSRRNKHQKDEQMKTISPRDVETQRELVT